MDMLQPFMAQFDRSLLGLEIRFVDGFTVRVDKASAGGYDAVIVRETVTQSYSHSVHYDTIHQMAVGLSRLFDLSKATEIKP